MAMPMQMQQQQPRSGFSQFLMGTPASIHQVNRFDPQQQGSIGQLNQMGLQGLQNPYAGFNPIEQHARSQFMQNTVPTLAERFSSLGSNATSSPAFASQLGQAGSGLEEALASMRSQYGQQNMSQMMQMLGMGLTPQFENFKMDAQPGFMQQILPALAQAGMYASGAGFAAPAGMSFMQGAKGGLGEIMKMLASPQQQYQR